MFEQKYASCFFLFLVILIPICVNGQDLIKNKHEILPNVEIICNRINEGGFSGIKIREIFILVEEKDFNLENLNDWFDKYQKLYGEPYNLNIHIFTSKEMLQRLIDYEKRGTPIEFNRDEKGREAARKYYEKYYPLTKGYLRTNYYRNLNFEYFDYSPKKEESEMVRIYLKKQIQIKKDID